MNLDSIFTEDYISSLISSAIMVITIIMIVAFLIGIICYVFESISLYHIANRRNLSSPGLAWIPIGQSYLIGKIADDALVKSGKKKSSLRIWLLWLSVAALIVTIVEVCISPTFIYESYGLYDDSVLVSFGLCVFLLILISLAILVLLYIALFNIYRSLSESYIVFFVLSIIFAITIPFFLFALRKQDHQYSK